ncbi:MAG: 3'-5' exonuclease [Alphaproteobacteria bacterium]|nr:3'-5' exonuclease [Alphaproteobacteria bacterium]
MDWRNLRIVAFDTETTGFNPHDGDRIIEFAAVELHLDEEGRVRRVKPYEMLFNPGIPIPSKIVQLTGIDDAKVADKPRFESRAGEVRKLLTDSICVAHNFPFDRAFLAAEFERAGLSWPDPIAEIDTVDLSMKVFPTASSHKLSEVSKRLGVRLEGAHRATNDAEACGRCFIEMAKREHAPTELEGMIEWADALGHPPENRYLRVGPAGYVVFTDGPHAGDKVEHHPVHLHWMTMARQRADDRWQYRFPESLRRWAFTFLKTRGAGRARQNAKSFGPQDWVIDSNALPLPSQPRRR